MQAAYCVVYEARADEQELVPTGLGLLLELLELLVLLELLELLLSRVASRGYLLGRYYEETLSGEWRRQNARTR